MNPNPMSPAQPQIAQQAVPQQAAPKAAPQQAAPQAPKPVVQTKIPKSEFKKLTNEWNETHEKLTNNFRDLNIIFADIKFLLQKLESQLAAAGIKSEVKDCFEEVQSCLKSFSNANAHAAALDIHLKQLDKNVFDKASQNVQETLKVIREKITEAGNIGRATGIPGVSQDASGTQATLPTAPTGTVTSSTAPAVPTGTVTSSTAPAVPTGTVASSSPPVLSFNETIRSCTELLGQIDEKCEKIWITQNLLTKKIGNLKKQFLKLEQEKIRLSEELRKIDEAWVDAKKLFDEQKDKKEKAARSGVPFTQVEQAEYDLKRKNLQSLILASLQSIVDINKNLEQIDRKYQNLLDKLNEAKDKKYEIDSLFKSASKMKADVGEHLADSRLKTYESILVKANRKHRANEFFEEIQKRDDGLELQENAFKIIKDNLENMNNRFLKINNEIIQLKSVAKKMKNEIHPYSFPFWY